MNRTVLILGGADDEQACFMLEYLREHGQDAELLDSQWFPAKLGLAHDPATNEWALQLPSGRGLASGQVKSVYWCRFSSVPIPNLPDEEQSLLAGNDARSLFESFLVRYPARWVNGWPGYLLDQTRPAALAVVAGLGVEVPATLSTNDPEAVRAFAARWPRALFKPIQGGARSQYVTPRHLSDHNLKNLRYAPVMLQEEIPGRDVRVFVAGERVLACEGKASTLDSRDPAVALHQLPSEMEGRCRRIAAALHLVWAGIDFRLTSEGRYVFLQANPSPRFLGYEASSGLPLTASLADLLIRP